MVLPYLLNDRDIARKYFSRKSTVFPLVIFKVVHSLKYHKKLCNKGNSSQLDLAV